MATHTSPAGTITTVPAPGDIADGPLAFANFADSLDAFLPPVGAVVPYFGATAPAGWLMCDGGAIPADAKYARLKALVGNNTPNLRGRFLVGVDPSDSTFGALATQGGSKRMTSSATITSANLPNHTHVFTGTATTYNTDTGNAKHSHGEDSSTQDNTASAHTHATMFRTASNFTRSGTGSGLVPESNVSQADRTSAGGANAFTHSHSIHSADAPHNHSITVTPQGTVSGGGQTTPTPLSLQTEVVPPFTAVNYIIRAA